MDIHSVCLPVLVLKVATVAHVVTEKLGEILGFTIGFGPSVVGGLPRRCRLCFLFVAAGRLNRIAFFVQFLFNLFFDLFLDSLLDHVGSDVESGLLFLVLEANDTDDFANVALNGKELVHEAELQTL